MLNNIKILVANFSIIFMVISCGINQDKKEKTILDIQKEKMPIEQALDSLKLRGKNINNFEGSFNFKLQKGKDEYELKGLVKIERGKYIWINLVYFGISMARIKITPEKFLLFEKLGSRYIDKKLSYVLKTYAPLLKYKSIENMFIGTDITEVLKGKYKIENKPYRQFLISEDNIKNNIEKSILIYKSEIMSQMMKDSKSEIKVNYVGLDDNMIPREIKAYFKKGSFSMKLEMEYINVIINQDDMKAPFEIPKGYSSMEI